MSASTKTSPDPKDYHSLIYHTVTIILFALDDEKERERQRDKERERDGMLN